MSGAEAVFGESEAPADSRFQNKVVIEHVSLDDSLLILRIRWAPDDSGHLLVFLCVWPI